MALDVGDKTIGVAVSDPLLVTAQGVGVIERVGIRKDADKVIALAEERECATILVGLPKKLDGSNSIQTDKVEEFKSMLENKLRSNAKTHICVLFHDERFTTVLAERVLIEANVSRKKRKTVIDKQAAVVILQSYLDEQRNAQGGGTL
jgi:putative Holliday junction resolvase